MGIVVAVSSSKQPSSISKAAEPGRKRMSIIVMVPGKVHIQLPSIISPPFPPPPLANGPAERIA
ncbi:hypothetical protein GCM10023346_37960 [Arthrobacter gyeryongensis]|uniref:Uncharacterized protein n=1 Tax=Arthrobacter gyeryongensis TaxID=1650592 RepID=A0ABP9SQX0_9MICC